jgi:hypothetical protein
LPVHRSRILIITDGMTTVTIGTPSAPTVAQTSKDANGDGAIDMGLKLSLGSLPSGAYAIVFKIDEYLSDNTTLVDTYYVHPRKLAAKYPGVIADHYYRVSVAGIGFNNHEGSFSSVTTLQATGKTSGPAAPTGVGLTATALGFYVWWTDPNQTDADYAFSQVGLTTGTGTAPADPAEIVASCAGKGGYVYVNRNDPIGTAYWVWVRHVNKSNVYGSWTRYTTAQYTTIGLLPNAYGAGSVDTPALHDDAVTLAKMANASVGTAELIDGNVTYAKLDSAAVPTAVAATIQDTVGSYGFLKNNTGSLIAGNATVAGSSLVYSDTSVASGSAASGTWRAMGRCPAGQATLFLRIS